MSQRDREMPQSQTQVLLVVESLKRWRQPTSRAALLRERLVKTKFQSSPSLSQYLISHHNTQ